MNLIDMLRLLHGLLCGIVVLFALIFIFTSLAEGRKRAAGIGFLIFFPVCSLYLFVLRIPFSGNWILWTGLLWPWLIAALCAIPRPNRPVRIVGTQERIDERDAIFHRFYRLQPGTDDFVRFYKEHPHLQDIDQELRRFPELGYPGSRSYHPLSSLYQMAVFDVLEKWTRDVDSPPCPVDPTSARSSTEEYTRRIKGFARYLGADLVGITKLNPAYVYTHIGRSPGIWGAPIELTHSYAIAIAVEMRHEMVRHAPDVASTTETAFQYLEAGKIAILLAKIIQRWGFQARPHVDGNYRLLCVPVAADAGLGELGRLGLLITPEFGPRIRLAVVTTELPLVCDSPIAFGVQDFCSHCRKCAFNCPSNAISKGEKETLRGVEKWITQQEACYRFWRMQGSDCSLCLKVCPYSHPKGIVHDTVRKMVRLNSWTRRAALLGDDLFYGRRSGWEPGLPEWHTRIFNEHSGTEQTKLDRRSS